MIALLKFSGTKGTSKLLVGMLAASILTNIVFAARLYLPNAWHQLRLMMIPAPQLTADDYIRGPADATTTVIVYTNYQCPYCARLNADLTTLEAELGFRLTYRLYADQAQVMAFKAASAAQCAGDQGKFWEYGDQLFIDAKTLNEKDLPQIAEHLKLDVASFTQCITTEKYKDELLAAKQQAENIQINATPTYFINGKRYVGTKPLAQLKKLIVTAPTST
jgi:protein-disulfide isomerase